MTQIGVRRLATQALALYVTLGILTLLHWEFVWLKGVCPTILLLPAQVSLLFLARPSQLRGQLIGSRCTSWGRGLGSATLPHHQGLAAMGFNRIGMYKA